MNRTISLQDVDLAVAEREVEREREGTNRKRFEEQETTSLGTLKYTRSLAKLKYRLCRHGSRIGTPGPRWVSFGGDPVGALVNLRN